MMRTNIRRKMSVDLRAKIKTGEKHERGYPVSLSYFKINAFPELIEAYGEKPDKIFIMFPSDNIEDFFLTEYSSWASKGDSHVKKRECDGAECTHLLKESLNGVDYEAGEVTPCLRCYDKQDCPIAEKARCKSYTGIKAFILHPTKGKIINSTCYMFETHSDNSSDNLFTEIDKIWHMTGGTVAKIPFILSVNMVETTVPIEGEAKKRKFPIWKLQVWGTIEQVIGFSCAKQLPTTDDTAIVFDDSKALEAPKEREPELLLDSDHLPSPNVSGDVDAQPPDEDDLLF